MDETPDRTNRPQPIGIWLESLPSSAKAAVPDEIAKAKRDAILLLLGKLALHYWRPDFTPEQSRQLYSDYADDLEQYPLAAIRSAIIDYRQSGEKFYPQSGQLVQRITTPYAWESKRDRSLRLHQEATAEYEAIAKRLPAPSDQKRLGASPR